MNNYLFFLLDSQYDLIISDAFSPIIMIGAFVFPETTFGIIDPSTTRRPDIPYTLKKQI